MHKSEQLFKDRETLKNIRVNLVNTKNKQRKDVKEALF